MPSTADQPVLVSGPTGYSALAAEVRELGLMRRRTDFYGPYFLTNLAALAGVVAVMLPFPHSWFLLLLAPLFAVVSVQISFFGHDVGHRQVTRSPLLCRVLGLLNGNLLAGISYGWWIAKHNAHHAHPNDLETDPDVYAGAIVFDSGQALLRRGVPAFVTRHQAVLFFPFLLLEAFNLHLSSFQAVFRPGLRDRRTETVLLVVHVASYLALVITTLSWLQAILFVLVHKGLQGVYLGCSFAPGHKGMPVMTPEQARDPLSRQVLTSRNIRSGPVVDLLLGGLNFQIEHHLFPSMPRANLRLAQPVVRRFCEANGISYEETTLFHTYVLVLQHLREVGAGLRAAA
jgi:fatty acid desaturase